MSPEWKNPAHWEGSQYLLDMEIDPKSNPAKPTYRYTEAARKAQNEKWRRLIANRKPRKSLPVKLLPSAGTEPPLLLYGWPFNEDYLIEYAKNHRLVYRTKRANRKLLDNKEEFNFGDVTEHHYANKKVMNILRSVVYPIVLRELIRTSGVMLEVGRPLSLEYDSILYMCTNYNFEEEFETPYILSRYKKIVEILDAAMNEGRGEGQRTKLRWWWSWDGNGVGVFTSVD